MSEKTVKNVITPNDLFIRDVFSRSKAFHIDIYQREYKWSKDQVEALLNDIELRFNIHNQTKNAPKDIQEEVLSTFEPYYLNTFLTHSEPLAIAIVDGQQRLTTLLLILIKLRQIIIDIENVDQLKGKTFSSQSIEKLIFEEDDFGSAARFKIYNSNREDVFRSLVENLAFTPVDETQSRVIENYGTISKYFDLFFAPVDEFAPYNYKKLTYYISYLLDRISIVEIKIERQKNVAMIFEVVNDRGLGLNPHEILKGKFLGSLEKEKKEAANKIWVKIQNDFYNSGLDLDGFFQTYFRAKYAEGKTGYDKFSDDHYHNELYRNEATLSVFQKFQKPELLHQFVTSTFPYFANLFLRLQSSYEFEHVFYNRLNGQGQQFLLMLSAIDQDDPLLNEKIRLVSKKYDQLFTIANLLEAWDSRDIQLTIQSLNSRVRGKSLAEINDAFDHAILTTLIDKEKIQDRPTNGLPGIFRYELFKGVRNQSHAFSKYVLMRIDRYLSKKLDMPSYMNESLEELETRFKTGRKYGLHLEHIIAHNPENKLQFTDPETGVLDEDKFNRTRNLLGVVLLLKDRQNESSNNESYKKKFARYDKSDFLWNRLLVGHLDVVDQRGIPKEWAIEIAEPTAQNTFPLEKIDGRQKSIFEVIRAIWLNGGDDQA